MCITILLIPILYYISIHYSYRPGWDIDIILKNIENILNNNTDKIMHGYYSRYANNLYITYIFLNVYKFSISIGIQNGYFVLLFIQSIIFSLGGLLIYKIADMHFKERYKVYSVCTWIIYILLVGLSPHIVLTYTDGIGMFLSLLLTYIIFKIENTRILTKKDIENRKKGESREKIVTKKRIIRGILIIIFTNLTILSYYIKPQIIIVTISYIIIVTIRGLGKIVDIVKKRKKIVNLDKEKKKQILNKHIYIGILAIIVIVTGSMTYLNIRNANASMGIDVDKEKRFNITHYAMLGWNTESKGVFTIKDENFSGKYKTLKERQKGNIEELLRRIGEMGIGGVINQIARKTLTNYNDGTFSGVATFVYIREKYEIERLNNNLSDFLKNIYYENGKYNMIYTQFVQCLWMGILVFNMFSYSDSKSTKAVIVILGVIGLYIFETIFEARSRYIFVYVPLYILIGVMGIKNTINWISRKIKDMKKRKNVISCIGK